MLTTYGQDHDPKTLKEIFYCIKRKNVATVTEYVAPLGAIRSVPRRKRPKQIRAELYPSLIYPTQCTFLFPLSKFKEKQQNHGLCCFTISPISTLPKFSKIFPQTQRCKLQNISAREQCEFEKRSNVERTGNGAAAVIRRSSSNCRSKRSGSWLLSSSISHRPFFCCLQGLPKRHPGSSRRFVFPILFLNLWD